jgi:hypothetical protein
MDLVVAGRADHEGLAALCCHECGPCWLAGAGVCEVGEPGDVVHLHLAAVLAQFAPVPLEPGNDLFAGVEVPAGARSTMTAVLRRLRGMPPNRATRGFWLPSRMRTASKQVRGPSGVSKVAL